MDLSESRLQTICLLILTVIVCGAVLHLLQIVFMPFVLAVFVSLGLSSLVSLQVHRLRLPVPVAVVTTLLLTSILFWLIGLLIVNSVEQILASASLYETQFHGLAHKLFKLFRFERFGLTPSQVIEPMQHLPIQSLIIATGSSILDIASLSFMVLLYVSYLLFVFARERLDSALWRETVTRVRSYLLVKTAVSVITGWLIGMTLWLCDVQFALAFGLIGCLLNFIPYAGPMIASLAPWPIILLTPDLAPPAMMVSLFVPGTLFFIVGNFIEPKVLGKSVQLHPLAVLLALIFWGALWGPLGVLLATPITGILALLSSYLSITRPLASILTGTMSDPSPGPLP
jgi:AI-2 transport protein TqsA